LETKIMIKMLILKMMKTFKMIMMMIQKMSSKMMLLMLT